MYKKTIILFLFIAAVLVIAVPVYANGKDAIGTQVNLFAGDQIVSGPFHVVHGHFAPPSEVTAFGKTSFTLEIDGLEQDGRFLGWMEDGLLFHATLYNFADGLPPGTYTFKGTWQDPCAMFYSDCDHKNQLADPPYVEEITVTVN